ncbi:MAG: enoyl-CoA hydratase [Methylocystis sp.]|uniref:enoyl-CoA hydratase n=1 Tax=Methylocystis sp. TaxID=1911079 RepID=UPI0039283DFF
MLNFPFLHPQSELSVNDGSLSTSWLKDRQALVLRKTRPGFDAPAIRTITNLLAAIDRGELNEIRYLVYDFDHGMREAPTPADGFGDIAAENSELIVDTPVITLAWARGLMSGSDFDFAMHCSAIVAEKDAHFSFSGDPVDLLGLYAAVGRTLGYVKAERLMENNTALTAEEARDLLIVRDVVEPQGGTAAIENYLAHFGRRYNASHAIFRAQRMVQPVFDRRSLAGLTRN